MSIHRLGVKTLQSHHMQTANYDPSVQELTLTFTNGYKEVRRMVPLSVFSDLSAAPSPGRYFHLNIKNRFPIKKL